MAVSNSALFTIDDSPSESSANCNDVAKALAASFFFFPEPMPTDPLVDFLGAEYVAYLCDTAIRENSSQSPSVRRARNIILRMRFGSSPIRSENVILGLPPLSSPLFFFCSATTTALPRSQQKSPSHHLIRIPTAFVATTSLASSALKYNSIPVQNRPDQD